jgi:hypothetical protein
MPLVKLDTFANLLATYVRAKLKDVHRAALLVRCTTDGSLVAAVFGNDNYAADQNARREVELVRAQIREASIQELAFGLSHDGYTWALLVKADCQGFKTQAGKMFRSEMLRTALDDAVWAAWRSVTGKDERPVETTRYEIGGVC